MRKLTIIFAVLTAFSIGLWAQADPGASENRAKKEREIKKYIKELEEDSLMNTTSWSVVIKNVKTGETIAERNSSASLSGASITKLLTTGSALSTLGGDFRYETELAYSGEIIDSTLYGTLYVVGGGDPTLGSDYDKFLPGIDSVFAVWKKAVNKAGIARVEGFLVADSRYFTLEPMVSSWSWDDADTYYGTGVLGLSFFENKCRIDFAPSDTLGKPVKAVSVFPEIPGVEIVNRTTTAEGRANQLWLNASPLHPLEHFVTGSLGRQRGQVTETGANRAAGLSLLREFEKYLSGGRGDMNVEYAVWDTYTQGIDTTAKKNTILKY